MNSIESFFLDAPVLGVLVFVFAAVISTLICYGITRVLMSPHIEEDSELLSGKIITRLGALHALILALMFAQEMGDYRDISRVVSKEASAIGDVNSNLREYDRVNQQSTAAIRGLIVEFIETALKEDRAALSEHQLSHQTFTNYHRINRQLRNLQPSNNDQEYLREQMLADWDTVSEFHLRVRTISEYEAPGFFWVVIITGFIVVVIPFYVYSPSIANLVILSTYATFNGLVMYVIFSIANPFTGALAIDSNILENLLTTMSIAPGN
jgi:hypothetical protein